MMLGLGLSAPQWLDLMSWLLVANLWMQGACLFVALPWLLVSKRRLRLRAADLPPVSDAGWTPFRDPRLLRGSLGIVLAVLVQAMWVAALLSITAAEKAVCAAEDASYGAECVGMELFGPTLFMIVLVPGTLAFYTTFHLVALRLVRTAWDANEWPQKMSLRERPALTLVHILRYSPLAWYAGFLVGPLLALSPTQKVLVLSLIAFLASFFVYGRFKRNKGNQAEPQSNSGS